MFFSIIDSDGKLPEDWEPIIDPVKKKDVTLRVVDLSPSSVGYKFALTKFHETMTRGNNYSDIVGIQRIQNRSLYGQYASKKKHLDTTNPKGTLNERWLFHGTNESAVLQINETNFNRSYS